MAVTCAVMPSWRARRVARLLTRRQRRQSLAGLTRARGLDRGVEREKVGLGRDLIDQATTSPMGWLRCELGDRDFALRHLFHRWRDPGGFADLPGNLADRAETLRSPRHRLNVGRRLSEADATRRSVPGLGCDLRIFSAEPSCATPRGTRQRAGGAGRRNRRRCEACRCSAGIVQPIAPRLFEPPQQELTRGSR